MDDVLDDLVRAARRCERAALAFDAEGVKSTAMRVLDAVADVEKSWSGGWFGYHAFAYIQGFRPKTPRDHFDTFSGDSAFNETVGGPWVQYDREHVRSLILHRANVTNLDLIDTVAKEADTVFTEVKAELLPTIDALLDVQNDTSIKSVREKIASLEDHVSVQDLFDFRARRANPQTRDLRAMTGGVQAPPHIELELYVASQFTHKAQLEKLAEHANYLVTYLQKRRKMGGKSVAKTKGKIFIGHGRSRIWRDLKDFVHERLGLPWDEFNRESTPGISTKERLETMLDDAMFAFIVMTAEDEHADNTKHARVNVVHEAGLFQGRLGFQRAIVLLEDGCEEFSNIAGLGQIRFPSGDLSSKFDEIRRVLEREKLV
jgi:predicted nucleotide-binding protein